MTILPQAIYFFSQFIFCLSFLAAQQAMAAPPPPSARPRRRRQCCPHRLARPRQRRQLRLLPSARPRRHRQLRPLLPLGRGGTSSVPLLLLGHGGAGSSAPSSRSPARPWRRRLLRPPPLARAATPLSSSPVPASRAPPRRARSSTAAPAARARARPLAARVEFGRGPRSPAAARRRRLHAAPSGGPAALLPARPCPCGSRAPTAGGGQSWEEGGGAARSHVLVASPPK